MNARLDVEPPQQPVNRLLWMAAAAGAEAEVRQHIAKGEYLEWRDKRGLTPLMVAASRDRANICMLLLDAGVNFAAVDVAGRDALTIAREFGALDAAEVIARWIPANRTASSAHSSLEGSQVPAGPIEAASDPALNSEARDDFDPLPAPETRGNVQEALTSLLGDWEPAESSRPPSDNPELARNERHRQRRIDRHVPIDSRPTWGEEEHTPERIFGDWEPVAPVPAPLDKPELAQIEALRQQRIGAHIPLDDSAAWDEFEAVLPEASAPLPRSDEAEFRSELRRIALMALREGSVPQLSVEDLFRELGHVETRNLPSEEQFLVVLNDLGAGTDERLPHRVGNEAFEVFVDPVESEAEGQAVDEALAFFEELRSGRNEPLRIYLRSIGSRPLLKAEREATLAKEMEAAVDQALYALARWPGGLRALLDSTAGADASPSILWPIVATTREELTAEAEAEAEAESEAKEDADGSSDRANTTSLGEADEHAAFAAEPSASTADALAAIAAIRNMARTPEEVAANVSLILDRLRSLRFRRPFLAKLADLPAVDRTAPAVAYRRAISELLASRDEMTRANLRLVYATARRYAHTGVPIEDLIQEGNVGLIKAVDRFDWRRGFRFSTMAMWWIKQQISRSIPDTAFLIRPPVHVHEKLAKLRILADRFERANGREPTFVELAAMLSVTLNKLETLVRPSSEPLPIDHVDALAALDSEAPADPMATVADREIELLLSKNLSKLKRKSEAIVRMRIGIGVGDALTLEQVGTAFEVTRERVRQIEAKAMRTLASARSREELAIATGRPVPERDSVEASDRDEDSESVGGGQEAVAMRAERRDAGARPVEASLPREIALSGDPANSSALPSSIRKIIDSALALGIEANVTADEGRVRIFVAEVPQSDRYSRKLVRDMLELGFVREAGKGYRR